MNARLGVRDVNGRPDRGNDIYASWERFFTSGQGGGIDFTRKGPAGYKGGAMRMRPG
jgi:hypothetical protein